MNHWTSWSEFLAMGGYGLYVWGSVLMTIALLAGEVVAVRLRRKAQLEMQRRYLANTRRHPEAKQ